MIKSVLRGALSIACAALFFGLALTASVPAENWPQRPVRVLLGFAPGGSIDSLARVACARLSAAFGQQFIVENRVGAMGSLAADAVARSPADGYTFFWAGTGTISILPAMSNTTYSFEKALEPVAMIGTSTQVLIVNPNFPAKTVGEFIERVKSQPGKLSYGGGGGPGSVSNLLMSLFLSAPA